MHKLRTIVVAAVTLALVGCQTLDGVRVNGLQLTNDAPRTQGQTGTSGWVWAALGIAGAVGVGLLAAGGGGGGGSHSGGGTGGGGGSTGGGTGVPTPGGSCNGCWDY